MASITGPREKETHSKTNTVLSVAEAKVFFVRYSDANGVVGAKACFQLGVDENDNLPGVVVFNEDAYSMLSDAQPAIKAAVRAHIDSGEAVFRETTPEAPAELDTSDLEDE